VIEETSKPHPHAASEAAFVELDSEVEEGGGIDLLELAVSFLAQWRLGLLVTLLVAIPCFLYVMHLKPQYVATAVILPQEGRSTDTVASLFSRSTPGTLYMGLLRSRTVQDIVIDRAHLMDVYHTKDRNVARGMLGGTSFFFETGDGLMNITVRDEDADEAAKIANTYLDALQQLNEDMGLQQSTRTRQFFEGQLSQERAALVEAEDRYQRLQGKTGLVEPSAQISSAITSIQGTRSQIEGLQVQRAALLRSETEQNPEVLRLDAQIAQLQVQERKQESAGPGAPVGAAPSAAQALEQNLELQRAGRDVGYYSGLVASMANQYEAARLNEIAARSAFQVVDRAIPPEIKAWPPRPNYLGISFAFSLLAGLLAVIIRLLSARVMAHAATVDKLRTLRGAFR
jgi:tyrosine-protein kinase Etk/Wzc